MILASLEQSLMLYPLVLGVCLSYQILKTTDLTAEGSFVLGAALYARLLTAYNNQNLAIISALLGGALCGFFVYILQRKGQMNALISSIIMLFMLYSVNLQIMGKPNISLLSYDVFESTSVHSVHNVPLKIIFLGLLGLVLTFVLGLFLKTRLGLTLRALGHNPHVLKKYGRNPEAYRLTGLIISNTLSAGCGALMAQFSGYADIHMGFGMALVGISAVAIGQHVLSSLKKTIHFSSFLEIIACFGGIYMYFLISHFLLKLDIDPINLRLCLGLILILCLRSHHLIKGTKNA
ncbi:MAG: ABC transporter permease [Alphaproteobacteria bacterium]